MLPGLILSQSGLDPDQVICEELLGPLRIHVMWQIQYMWKDLSQAGLVGY